MDDLRDRLVAALRAHVPRGGEVEGCPRAAVLVPVLSRAGGPTVLFTRRAESMRSHPGQISFPGGRLEPGEDAPAAALREAAEEVGLPPAAVEVLGLLDDRLSIARFLVTPVVGFVADPPAAFVAHAAEVVEPFEVPLARLLDRRHYREERWAATGPPPGWSSEEMARIRLDLLDVDPATATFAVSFFDGGDGRVIWGLTGRILRQLLDLAFPGAPAD